MMFRKTNVLSSYAVAAAVMLFVALTSGCDRKPEVYPLEGNAYMHDPEFIAQMDAQVAKRKEIRKDMMKLQDRLRALIAQHNGDRAAATNSVEGVEIVAALNACYASINSNRSESAVLIRERHQRAVEDSKRIARGEAKAKEISKKKEAK